MPTLSYNKSVQKHRKEVFNMQATFTRKKGTTKDGRAYNFIVGRSIPGNIEFTISKKAFPALPEEVKKLLEALPDGGLTAAVLPDYFFLYTPEDEEERKYPRCYLCLDKEVYDEAKLS